MEILFCGTAAAEGWPAVFCTCDPCQQARARGGKNLRSRAAYMLDNRIRIDFGPDSNLHQQKYGLAYERLEHILFTHSHEDHLYSHELTNRQPGFSKVPGKPLNLWGNAKVEEKLRYSLTRGWETYNLAFHRIAPWETIDLGEGVMATPVLASHDRSEECVNFIVESVGQRALFGHDTGWYDQPTWEFLEGKSLDLVILDCTYGARDEQHGHMGGMALIRVRDELARRGALAPDARCVATHFSHNGGTLHEELEEFFAPHGFSVAYDGLRMML